MDIQELYGKYLNGKCTPEELQLLMEHFNQKGEQSELVPLIDTILTAPEPTHADSERTRQILAHNKRVVFNAIGQKQRNYNGWAIAAAIVALLAAIGIISFVLTRNRHKVYTGSDVYKVASTIAPGSNRATLTLADGRTIDLSSAGNGNLAQQAGVTITKTANGQLTYTIAGQANAQNTSIPTHNTINTPKGGQYQVRLPDGTTVLLNAATTLTYPASFQNEKERRVVLDGEAYFEVAHNKAQPFKVQSRNQTVEVLGTHFNVNCYADEPLATTTLAQGGVKVYSATSTQNLVPGQQALTNATGNIAVQQADVATTLAWTTGTLEFNNTELPVVMRLIGRWYNINIRFAGQAPQRRFTGSIPRKSNLAAVLQTLSLSGINYTLETDKQGVNTLLVQP